MIVTSLLGLLSGAVLSAAFVLTSDWHQDRFTLLDAEGAIAITGSEPPGGSFVLYEPCPECRSRMKAGDHAWERLRFHRWIPVFWRRCTIERGGAVVDSYSAGRLGYFGVASLLAAVPPILALLLFPARKR